MILKKDFEKLGYKLVESTSKRCLDQIDLGGSENDDLLDILESYDYQIVKDGKDVFAEYFLGYCLYDKNGRLLLENETAQTIVEFLKTL